MLVAMDDGGGSTSSSASSPPSPKQLQGKENSAQTAVNQDESSLQSVERALSQAETRAAAQENYNVRQMLNLEAEIGALQARLATDKSALANDHAALNKSLASEIPDATTAAISAYGKAAAHTPGAPSLATASSNLQSATFNEEVLTYEQANGGDCWVPGSSQWQADAQKLLAAPDTLDTVRDEVAARHMASLAGNGLDPQHFAAQEWAGETVALAELQDPQSADGASGSSLTLAQKKQGEEQAASILSNSLTVEMPKSGVDPSLARAALFDNGYVATLGHEITGTMQAISASPNDTTADGIGYLYHIVGSGTFDTQLATALIAAAAPTLQKYLQEQSSASKDQASQAFVFTAGLYGVLIDAQTGGVPGAGKLAGELAQWSYAAADATNAQASFNGRGTSPLDNLLSEVLTKTQQQRVASNMLYAWQTLSQKATSTGARTDNVLAWYRFQTSLDGNAQLKARPPIKSVLGSTVPGMSSDEVRTTYDNAVNVLATEQQAGTLPAGANPLALAAVQTQMTAGFGGKGDQVALARAMIGTQQQGLDAAWEQKNSQSNELMPVDYFSSQADAAVLGMGSDIGLGGKSWSDAVNQAEHGMQASLPDAPGSPVIAATNCAYTKLTAAEASGNKPAIASAEEGWHKALIQELESVYGNQFSGDSLISNSENGNWAYLAEVQVVCDHDSSTAMAQAVSTGLQASEIVQLSVDGGQAPQESVFSLDSQLASLQQPGADPGGAITQAVLGDARVGSLIAGQVSSATTGKASDPAAALAHEAQVLEPYESQDPGGVVAGQILEGALGSTLTQQILANAKSAAAHTHDPLAAAAPLIEAAQLSPSLTLAVYHAFDIQASSAGKGATNELMVAAGSVHSAADYRDLAIVYGALPDNPGTVGVASQVKQAQQLKAGLIGAFGAELSHKNSSAAQNIRSWIPASFSGTDSASAWLSNDLTSGYQYEQGGKTITVGKLGSADLVTTIKGALYQATGGSSGNSSVTSGDSTVNMAAAASADGTTMQLFTSKEALASYVAQAYGLRPTSDVGGNSTYDSSAVVFGQTTLGQIVTGLMKQAGVNTVDAADPIVLGAAPVTVGEQQGAEFRVQRQDGSIVWLGSDGSVTEGWAGQNTNLTKNLSTTTVQVVGGMSEASAGGSVDDPLLKLDTPPPPPPVKHPWWESVAKDALAVTAGIVGTAVTGNPFIGFGAALAVQQVFDLATNDGEVTVFTYAHDAIDGRLSWNVTEQFAVDTGTEVISSAADAFAPGAASWAARGATSALTDAAGDAASDVAGATLTTRLAAAAAGGAVQSTIQGTASLTNSTITMAYAGQFTWGRFGSTAAQSGLDVVLSSVAGGFSGGLLSDGLATQTVAGFGTGLGQTEVDDLVFEHHNLTGDDVWSALMMTPATTLQLYADRPDGFQQIRQALGLSARGNAPPANDPPNEDDTGNPDDGVNGGGGDGSSDISPVGGAAVPSARGGSQPSEDPDEVANEDPGVSEEATGESGEGLTTGGAGGKGPPGKGPVNGGLTGAGDDEDDDGEVPVEVASDVPEEQAAADTVDDETDDTNTTVDEESADTGAVSEETAATAAAVDDESVDANALSEETAATTAVVDDESVDASTVSEETAATTAAIDEETADTSTVSEETAATNATVDEESVDTNAVSEETDATTAAVDEASVDASTVSEETAATNATVDEESVDTNAMSEETAATNATVDEESVDTNAMSEETGATTAAVDEESVDASTVSEETAATTAAVDEESVDTTTVSEETATTTATVDEEAADTDMVDERAAVVGTAGETAAATGAVDEESDAVDTADEKAGVVGTSGEKAAATGTVDEENATDDTADDKAGAVDTSGEKAAATSTVDEESATDDSADEKAGAVDTSGAKAAATGTVDEEGAPDDSADEKAGAVGTPGGKAAATSATYEETTEKTASAAEGVEGTSRQTVAGRDGSDVDTASAASAQVLPKSSTSQAGTVGAEESEGADVEEGTSEPVTQEGGATSAQPLSETPADPTSGLAVSPLRKPDEDNNEAEFDPATDQAASEEEGGGDVTPKGGARASADSAAASVKGSGGKTPKGTSEGAAAITSVKGVSRDDDPQQQASESDPSGEASKPSEEAAENTRKSRRTGRRKEARAARNAARVAEVAAKREATEDFVGALTDAAKATDASNKAGTEAESAKKAAIEASRKAAAAVTAAERAAEGTDAERRMSAWAAKRAAAEAVAASRTAVEAAKKSADAVAAATPREHGAPKEAPAEPAKKADTTGRAVAATEAANRSASEAGAANKAAAEAARKTAAAVEAAKAAAAETAKRAEAANKAAAEAAAEAAIDPEAVNQSAAAAMAAESAEEANKTAAKAAKNAEAASKTAAKAAKKVETANRAATAAAKEADTAKEAAAVAVAEASNRGEPGAVQNAEASNKGEPGAVQNTEASNKGALAAAKEAEAAQRRAAVAAAKAKNKADVAIRAANRAEAAAERAKTVATQLVKDIEAINKNPAEAANEAAKSAEAAAAAANQAADEAEATKTAAAKAAEEAASKSVSAVAGKVEGEPVPKPDSATNDDVHFARMRALAAAVRDRAPDVLSRSLLTKAGLTLAAAVFATADPALIGPFLSHLEHLLSYVGGELWNTRTDGTDWLTRNLLLAYRTTTEKHDLHSGEDRMERILEGKPKAKDLRVLKLVVRRYVRSNFDASHPERVAPARTRTLEAIQEYVDCVSQKVSPDTSKQARVTENLLRALGSLHGICTYDADGNIVPNYNVEDIVEHLFNRWENRLRDRLFFNMLGTYTRAMNVTHNVQQFSEPESRGEFHTGWDGFWEGRAPGVSSWVGDGGFLNDSLDYFPALGVEGISSTAKVVADVDRLFMRHIGRHLGIHDILGVRAALQKVVTSPKFIKTRFWAELIGYACYIPACAGWSLEDLLRNGYHKFLPPDFTKPAAEAVVTLWSVVDSHSMMPKEPDSAAEPDPANYPQRPFSWQYRKGWNWTRADAEDLSLAALISKQRRVYFGQRIKPFKHVNVEQLFGVSISIADSWKPEVFSAYKELTMRFIHTLITMYAKR